MRDGALRRLRIINPKSNRITSFRQSSDFSHDLGRRLSLDNGWLLLVPRATLAQAEKPLRPTKNGSIKDGTILGIRWLGDFSVPFRLSPRRQGCLIALNGFPSGEVAPRSVRGRCFQVVMALTRPQTPSHKSSPHTRVSR